ncbi:MAG: hypothetical protein ACHQF2_05185 [Flavobacteriales bacterium]
METMNRWTKWLFVLISLVSMQACNEKAKEEPEPVDEQAYIDEIKEKDSIMQLIFASMDDIEAELVKTKENQGILSLNSPYPEQPGTPQKDRILLDIQLLDHLLAENKQKLDEYKQKMGGFKNGEKKYLAQVAEFENMLKERDAAIEKYKGLISLLETDNALLAQRIDSLQKTGFEKDEVIKQKDEQLLTAYVAKGTRKELKNKGIIESKGGILGIGRTNTISPTVDRTQLTSLNIQIVTSIPVNSKKAKLISVHPPSSYVLNREGNEITTLEIINVEEFWKNSKYLVLETN